MAVHEIVNRDLINLVNCEHEPIHIPGSVQPHGFVLILRHETLTIEYCSANITSFTQQSPAAVLSKTLTSIFTIAEADGFRRYLDTFIPGTSYPYVFTLDNVSYNTIVNKLEGLWLLELEPFPDGHLSLPDLYRQTRNFISFIEGTDYLQDLCQAVAAETRNITGYDRVMIYRFDKDYNGEVFAESKREDLDSFLEHRYPHTDIPVQARQLYLRNLLRIIVDVNYEPVPLLTLNDKASNASVDLSDAVLRSVSPIHIEYLKNMGVAATLTISLIHNNKLWGLIACHHYTPRNLPHYTRLAAQMQGHFLTSQISVREVKEEYDISVETEKSLQTMQQILLQYEDFIPEVHRSPELLGLANAAGAAILFEGHVYKSGDTPDDEDIRKLAGWMAANAKDGFLETDHLSARSKIFEEIANVASGIIYYSLDKHTDNCVIWFRPEVVQTINWAGDPDKAVLKGEDGMRLTPRKSFDLWRQEVKCKSMAWRKPELNATASFTYALQKNILYRYLSKEEKRYRTLSEKLQEANDELANINWISTHDLKEPLRKIQIFGSRILDMEKDSMTEVVVDSVERMRSAANRMQQLLDDILSYSQISNKEQAFAMNDLDDILADVLAGLKEELDQKQAIVAATALPVVHSIDFQLKQVFVNLVSNALKFAKQEEPLRISITADIVNAATLKEQTGHDKYHRVIFRDNGIGFDNIYASRIFEVFQRLHLPGEYRGTGIGLAICRKIMSNHEGYITADGQPGAGATFTLYFPVVKTTV